jgi:hypothetical protein
LRIELTGSEGALHDRNAVMGARCVRARQGPAWRVCPRAGCVPVQGGVEGALQTRFTQGTGWAGPEGGGAGVWMVRPGGRARLAIHSRPSHTRAFHMSVCTHTF